MKKEFKTTALIIGAGPIGLAAAAKLYKHKIDFLVVEKGPQAGNNILEWGHVQLFSKWKDNVDTDVEKLLLDSKNHEIFCSEYSNGHEFVEYYLKPFSQLPEMQSRILFDSCITKIELWEEQNNHYFKNTVQGKDLTTISSKFVIDASGTWGNHNSIFKNQQQCLGDFNIQYNIPNVNDIPFATQIQSNFLVIGSGHSAMNSILELTKCSKANIHWAIRNEAPRFGKSKVGGQSDNLEKLIEDKINKGSIQLYKQFDIKEITKENGYINITSQSGESIRNITQIFANVGHYPDYSFISNFNIRLHEEFLTPLSLAPKVDPQKQSCGSISYSMEDLSISSLNYFVVGMKSFGTASNFLLKPGYKVLDEIRFYDL